MKHESATAGGFLERSPRFAPASVAPPRLLLTPPEAATALRLCPRTLWTLTKAGTIPHIRIGRQIRYPVAVLEEWITKQTTAPVAEAERPPADAN